MMRGWNSDSRVCSDKEAEILALHSQKRGQLLVGLHLGLDSL